MQRDSSFKYASASEFVNFNYRPEVDFKVLSNGKALLHDVTIQSLKQRVHDPLAWPHSLWSYKMCQTLGISTDYVKVTALLITWHSSVADPRLHCSEETDRIEQIFKEKFGFRVVRVELEEIDHHQQLFTALERVLEAADSSGLTIVYYNGHGSYSMADEYLNLHP
jgi:hypothetical protein